MTKTTEEPFDMGISLADVGNLCKHLDAEKHWYRFKAKKELKQLSDHMQRGLHKLAVQLLGDHLPYGFRTNEDGSESLFDTSYTALWTRLPDGRIEGGGPYGGYEEILFEDRHPAYQQYESMLRLKAILKKWRV